MVIVINMYMVEMDVVIDFCKYLYYYSLYEF